MAIPEITERHIAEWALAWWRRENSPSLLRYGVVEDYDELDEQMLGYADGASLSPPQAFAGLMDSFDPEADDFLADVVAGMLLAHQCGRTKDFDEWLSDISDTPVAYEGYRSLMRWIGKPAVPEAEKWLDALLAEKDQAPNDPEIETATKAAMVAEALASHQPADFRFIDAFGEVRGHFYPDCLALDAPPETDDLGCICSYLLAHHEHVQTTLQQVIGSSHDPAIAFLVAGVSGDLSLLPWLLRCLDQPELTFLAADAFRRITGFDAVGIMELDDCEADSFDKAELKSLIDLIKDWHAEHGETFGTGYRFLGTVGDIQDIAKVLRDGCQVDREVAAMRAAMPSQNLVFPVRSRGDIQRLVLDHFPEHRPEYREAS